MFSLQNKIAVVTGGGSGIGRAVAELFAEQGAEVWVFDQNPASAEETVKRIHAQGHRAQSQSVDVTDQKSVLQAVENVILQSFRLDLLVNSAGISHIGTLETTREEDFERLFRVNVKGTYNAMFACLPWMKKQNSGVILNLASVAASVGLSERFAYSMTKGAVVSMTYSVAKDYVKQGVRCNCVSPGRVHTPFVDGFLKSNYPGEEAAMLEKLSQTQPLGRMAQPQEIAALALYLCSDEAAFITGTDYPIDGGLMRLNT